MLLKRKVGLSEFERNSQYKNQTGKPERFRRWFQGGRDLRQQRSVFRNLFPFFFFPPFLFFLLSTLPPKASLSVVSFSLPFFLLLFYSLPKLAYQLPPPFRPFTCLLTFFIFLVPLPSFLPLLFIWLHPSLVLYLFTFPFLSPIPCLPAILPLLPVFPFLFPILSSSSFFWISSKSSDHGEGIGYIPFTLSWKERWREEEKKERRDERKSKKKRRRIWEAGNKEEKLGKKKKRDSNSHRKSCA